MDGRRFDDLARRWSRRGERGFSRRRVVAGLTGAVLGAVGGAGGRGATAIQGTDFTGLPCGGPGNIVCPAGYGCAAPRMVGAYGRCFLLGGGEEGEGQEPESGSDPAADPCAAVRCAAGYRCCDDCGRANCLPAGVVCPDRPCGPAAEPPPPPPPVPDPCAAVLCETGSTCCSECDGVCAPAGTACADLRCEWLPCGTTGVTCGPGEFCCNSSCGICAPLGGVCTLQLCAA